MNTQGNINSPETRQKGSSKKNSKKPPSESLLPQGSGQIYLQRIDQIENGKSNPQQDWMEEPNIPDRETHPQIFKKAINYEEIVSHEHLLTFVRTGDYRDCCGLVSYGKYYDCDCEWAPELQGCQVPEDDVKMFFHRLKDLSQKYSTNVRTYYGLCGLLALATLGGVGLIIGFNREAFGDKGEAAPLVALSFIIFTIIFVTAMCCYGSKVQKTKLSKLKAEAEELVINTNHIFTTKGLEIIQPYNFPKTVQLLLLFKMNKEKNNNFKEEVIDPTVVNITDSDDKAPINSPVSDWRFEKHKPNSQNIGL